MYSRKRWEKTYMYRLLWCVTKEIRKKEKENPGNIFIFAYFFWLEKSMLCWNNKRIFDPENFWKLLEEIVWFPPFICCGKKKDWLVDSKIRKIEKLPQIFFSPFCYFWADPSDFFFSKTRKWGEQNLGKFFTFSYFWKCMCPRHLANTSKNTAIFYMGSLYIFHMPDAY